MSTVGNLKPITFFWKKNNRDGLEVSKAVICKIFTFRTDKIQGLHRLSLQSVGSQLTLTLCWTSFDRYNWHVSRRMEVMVEVLWKLNRDDFLEIKSHKILFTQMRARLPLIKWFSIWKSLLQELFIPKNSGLKLFKWRS